MSSAISTKEGRVRLKPDATGTHDQPDRGDRRSRPADAGLQTDHGLQPWQFFVLAALGLATAATFMVRGQGVIPIVMLSVLMGTTAIAGFAALRLVRPLVAEDEDHTPMVGDRTRAALEREKMLALRAIKELDFDRAMGKLSESDWKEMSGRLRSRAARLIRQLDAGAYYREQIERDVAKRLTSAGDARLKPSRSDDHARLKPSRSDDDSRLKASRSDEDARLKPARAEDDVRLKASPSDDDARLKPSRSDDRRPKESHADDIGSANASAERACLACATANDADARFCKNCGTKLL
jgi:hypothetical protein